MDIWIHQQHPFLEILKIASKLKKKVVIGTTGFNRKQEDKIKSIIGPALKILSDLRKKEKKFDLVFIDADKENYKNYFNHSIELVDKDGLIVIDNVLWHGEVVDVNNQDKLTTSIREFNTYVNQDKRVENLIIPVGDGLSVCRKL